MTITPGLGNLYVVDLSYAYFGIIESEGSIVQAAPIGRWMIGKTLSRVESWVHGKSGKITEFVSMRPLLPTMGA